MSIISKIPFALRFSWCILLSLGFSQASFSQAKRGTIFQSSTSVLGRAVMDPNNDGFVSRTTAGWTVSTPDYGNSSELKMVAIPIYSGEPVVDQRTGKGIGALDLVSSDVIGAGESSVYILYREVSGVDYLMVRFRVNANTKAPKGWTLLIDTDGTLGPESTNRTSSNPGFEKEIILGGSSGVSVYDYPGGNPVLVSNYSVETNHQRSFAASNQDGDPDYFFDFFVPLADLNLTGPVRMCAGTATSANSGLSGTISDINGIDDQNFTGDLSLIYETLIQSFPSTDLTEVNSDYTFPAAPTIKPTITSAINISSTEISGICPEANGTEIEIFYISAGNTISVGTATVDNSLWSFDFDDASTSINLDYGDAFFAVATATGKAASAPSNTLTLTQVSACNLAAPVITSVSHAGQGSQPVIISGTYPGTYDANLRVDIYLATTTGYPSLLIASVPVGGVTIDNNVNKTWTYTTNNANALPYGITNGNVATQYFTAQIRNTTQSCSSGYSNVRRKNAIDTTTRPNIISTSVSEGTGPHSIEVKNNDATTAKIYLLVNGVVVDSVSNIAAGANHTFYYNDTLFVGDVVTTRAQAGTKALSNVSNSLSITIAPTTPPVIVGSYFSGAGNTVSGYSTELPGTSISLTQVIGGVPTVIGTTTTDIFGSWSIDNLTLTTGAKIYANATAVGKPMSAKSDSLTISATKPNAPTINTPVAEGDTEITGSGLSGTVIIYLDGVEVGQADNDGSGNWSFDFGASYLYKGAIITAVNVDANGNESDPSNEVSVTGVDNYLVVASTPNPVSGVPFTITITARDASNNVMTNFNGTVLVTREGNWARGFGETVTFTNGVLTSHEIVILSTGNDIPILVLDAGDPMTFGQTTVDVSPIEWTGSGNGEFGTAANWNNNAVPEAGAEVVFSNTADNMILSANHTIGSLNIPGTGKLILNGYTLTVLGELNVGEEKIDAEDGKLVFNGSSKQIIPSNALINNTIDNLTIDNQFNVQFLGDSTLYLTGVLELTNGVLDIGSRPLVLKALSYSNYAQIGCGGSGTLGTGAELFIMEKSISNDFGKVAIGWRQIALPVQTVLDSLKGPKLYGSGTSLGKSVYYWDAEKDNDPGIAKGWVVANTAVDGSEKAYIIYGDTSKNFGISKNWYVQGEPFNGNFSFNLFNTEDPDGPDVPGALPVDYTGWNMVPNPYPSNLDIQSLFDAPGFPGYAAVHIWDPVTEQYVAVRKTGSGLTIVKYNNEQETVTPTVIPPFQSFWVKLADTDPASTTILLSCDQRTTSMTGIGTFLKKEEDLLRLNITHPQTNKGDQFVIYANEKANANFDEDLDAYKMLSMNPKVPSLYGLDAHDQRSSIKSFNPTESMISFPLGVRNPSKGKLVFSIDAEKFFPEWSVEIEDRTTGTRHDLRKAPYEVTVTEASDSRFVLHISQWTAGVQEDVNLDQDEVVVGSNGSEATVNFSGVPHQMEGHYQIFSMDGKLLMDGKRNWSAGLNRIDISSLEPAIYILKIEGLSGAYRILRH